MIPARVVQLSRARERYGDRVDRLIPFLLKTDPLADAVVDEMAAMRPGVGWAMLREGPAEGIDRVAGAPGASCVRALLVASRMEGARERVDLLQQRALSQGSRYWDEVLRVGLANMPAELGLPNHLAPGRSAASAPH